MCFNTITKQKETSQIPFQNILAHIFSPPLCMFILPSFCLSDSPAIVPNLLRELICCNIPTAHCDHLVNTPIILSVSASPSHPTMGMTPRAWQFNLPVTDDGYHGSTHAPALSCWLLFLPAKREMLLERVPLFTPLDSSNASSPHHHSWSSGERCCHLFMWPCPHTHTPPLCTYQANYYPIATPFCCYPPVLCNIMEELLIHISRHDASQPAVITPSACHWYTPPPPLLF